MTNRLAGNAIKKNPRGRGRKNGGHPIPEPRWEAPTLKKVKQVLPTYGIKGFPNVKFEEKGRKSSFVETRGEILNVEEIVMDTSFLDKGTLCIGNKIIHARGKPRRKQLGNNLRHTMDKANRPEIGDLLRPFLLRQKSNVCGIQPMKIFDM
jgi:hypothetical protein